MPKYRLSNSFQIRASLGNPNEGRPNVRLEGGYVSNITAEAGKVVHMNDNTINPKSNDSAKSPKRRKKVSINKINVTTRPAHYVNFSF